MKTHSDDGTPILYEASSVMQIARQEARAEVQGLIDLIKPLLPLLPALPLPGTPPTLPAPPGESPVKSRTALWVSIAVAILIGVFGAWKSNWTQPITIPPFNPAAAQSQPAVIVVHVPTGSSFATTPAAK